MQLQLHYTNYTTPQLQLHYITTTTTAALHHAACSSCGWGDRPGDHCSHCNHSKKHDFHQWIRSAIRDSQQPTSPIGFLFLKLPPPPCAVLLVIFYLCLMHYMIACIHYLEGWKDGWMDGWTNVSFYHLEVKHPDLTETWLPLDAMTTSRNSSPWGRSDGALQMKHIWPEIVVWLLLDKSQKMHDIWGISPGILDQWMLHEDSHR